MSVYRFIIEFVQEFKERRSLIDSFNEIAHIAFVSGNSDRLLKAKSTAGDARYKHPMSRFFLSGFRIEIRNGTFVTLKEVNLIGTIFLDNKHLLRQLMALGYDTLEVTAKDSNMYRNFDISSFASLKNYFLPK